MLGCPDVCSDLTNLCLCLTQNWLVAETVGAGHDPLDVFLRAGPAALPDSSGQSRDTWVITCRRAGEKGVGKAPSAMVVQH